MGKKLYVGNLPYSLNDQKMEELFKSCGEVVSSKVICDFDSGRSKGFGFVEMASEEDATTAIKEMNGKEVEGRNLKVSEAIAKPRTDRR